MIMFSPLRKLFVVCLATFNLAPSLSPRLCHGLFLFSPGPFFWSKQRSTWRIPGTTFRIQKHRLPAEKGIPFKSSPAASGSSASKSGMTSSFKHVKSSRGSRPETSNYLGSSDYTGGFSKMSDETWHELVDAPLTIFQVKQPKQMNKGQPDVSRGGRKSQSSRYFSEGDDILRDSEADPQHMETQKVASEELLLEEKARLLETLKRAWDLAMKRVATKHLAGDKGFDPWHGKRRKRSTEFENGGIKDHIDSHIKGIMNTSRIPTTRPPILLPSKGTEEFTNSTMAIRTQRRAVSEDAPEELPTEDDFEDQFLYQTHDFEKTFNETLLDFIFKSLDDTTSLSHQMEMIKEELIRQTAYNSVNSSSKIHETTSPDALSLPIPVAIPSNENILKRKPFRSLFNNLHQVQSSMTKLSIPKQTTKESWKTSFPYLSLPKNKDISGLNGRLALKMRLSSKGANIKNYGAKFNPLLNFQKILLSDGRTILYNTASKVKIDKLEEEQNNTKDFRTRINSEKNGAKLLGDFYSGHTAVSNGIIDVSSPRPNRTDADSERTRSPLGLSRNGKKKEAQRGGSRFTPPSFRHLLANLLKYLLDGSTMKRWHKEEFLRHSKNVISHSWRTILFKKQSFLLKKMHLSDNMTKNGTSIGVNVSQSKNSHNVFLTDVDEEKKIGEATSLNLNKENLTIDIDIKPADNRSLLGETLLSSATKKKQTILQEDVRKLARGNMIHPHKMKPLIIGTNVGRCGTLCQRRFTKSANSERPIQEDTHSNMPIKDLVDWTVTRTSKFPRRVMKKRSPQKATKERTPVHSKDNLHPIKPHKNNKSIDSWLNFIIHPNERLSRVVNQNPVTLKRDKEKTDFEILNNFKVKHPPYSSAQSDVKAFKPENPTAIETGHEKSIVNSALNHILWGAGQAKSYDKTADIFRGRNEDKKKMAYFIFKRCFKDPRTDLVSQKMMKDLSLILSLLNKVVTIPQTQRRILSSFSRHEPYKRLNKTVLQSRSKNSLIVKPVNSYFRNSKVVSNKNKSRRKRDLTGLLFEPYNANQNVPTIDDDIDIPHHYWNGMVDGPVDLQGNPELNFGDVDNALYDQNVDEVSTHSPYRLMPKKMVVKGMPLEKIPTSDPSKLEPEDTNLNGDSLLQFDMENMYKTHPGYAEVPIIKNRLAQTRSTNFERNILFNLPPMKFHEIENVSPSKKVQDSLTADLRRKYIDEPYREKFDTVFPVNHHRKHNSDSIMRTQGLQQLWPLYKAMESRLTKSRSPLDRSQIGTREQEHYDMNDPLSEIGNGDRDPSNALQRLRSYPDEEEVTLTYLPSPSPDGRTGPLPETEDWLAAFSIVRPLGFSQFVK